MPPKIRRLSRSGQVLDPNVHKINVHESVKRRMSMQQQQEPIMGSSSPNCKWYDVACFLRWLWQSAGVQFGAIVGTMEPKYDADAYPNGKYLVICHQTAFYFSLPSRSENLI